MKPRVLTLFAFLSLLSCRKVDTGTNPAPPAQSDRGVFIINEGAFPGPGTVSFYDISRDSVIGTVVGTSANWQTTNDGGVVGNKLCVVVDGNVKIEILNAATFQPEGTITFPAGSMPGFITTVDTTWAYVANYNGSLSEVNLIQQLVVRTSGRVVSFPGGIAFAAGRVFVSDVGSYVNPNNVIKMLDTASFNILDSLRVGRSPGMMAKSPSGILYVVCAENYSSPGKIYAVNTNSDIVFDSTTVGVGPSDIAIKAQSIYVLHSDRVMKLSAIPLSVVDTTFIRLTPAEGLYFYALAIDPQFGDLYVSRIVNQ